MFWEMQECIFFRIILIRKMSYCFFKRTFKINVLKAFREYFYCC